MSVPPPPEIYLTSWHIPYSIIRKWPRANLVDPIRRRGAIPLVAILIVISTGFVAARLYGRFTKRAGRCGADDILIVVAWVLGVVSAIGSFYAVTVGGLDMHIWDAFLIGSRTGLTAWIQEFSFIIGSCLTKISVLVFYRRIFFTAERIKRILWIDAAIGFLIAYMFAVLMVLILNCRPVAAYWESMDPNYSQPYSCISRNVFDPAKGIFSVISDAYALLLPQFLIWKLQIGCASKWRLAFTFGVGWLATGAGIARTVLLSRLFTDPLRDLTWIGYEVQVWAEIEVHLAIVCACVPAAISFTKNFGDRCGSQSSSITDVEPVFWHRDEPHDLEKVEVKADSHQLSGF